MLNRRPLFIEKKVISFDLTVTVRCRCKRYWLGWKLRIESKNAENSWWNHAKNSRSLYSLDKGQAEDFGEGKIPEFFLIPSSNIDNGNKLKRNDFYSGHEVSYFSVLHRFKSPKGQSSTASKSKSVQNWDFWELFPIRPKPLGKNVNIDTTPWKSYGFLLFDLVRLVFSRRFMK